MSSEIVKPGERSIDSVCEGLKAEHPDWILLDESYLKSLDLDHLPETSTFIVPGYLVDKKQHQRKINTLVSYLMVTSRLRGNNFKVVANGWEEVDLRIRRYFRNSEEVGPW